jgi:secreted trypsin-like serine protease
MMRKILLLFQLLLLTIQTFAQECGKSKSAQALVFGGTAVNIGDFPWVVPLFYKTGDTYFCGSNLISDQYLLTGKKLFFLIKLINFIELFNYP